MAEPEHAELRRIFELALAVRGADRGELLARECGADAGLRRRVEGMIAAAEDERFLAEPTANVVPGPRSGEVATVASRGVSVSLSGEGPGTRIGPYKLLQLIGEGGFGSVFMAEQERPVARKVALKIIKLGMDTRAVIARFEAERQALAMMDHPNIAKVLDVGATEAGRPYFVMDLVKGDPIAEYCDKNNLSIEERLELFAQVCQAVQHAHTKGIIHRDIKPSNILVSTQDGRPSAKVIDFGIAKATASKLTERTLFTEHKALIGTPEYMSPEQAEGSMDIDTRTDVYSLGVLLYELLTGSTPFSSNELRSAAYAEIQRIIREVDPPRPSTRLSQSADTIAGVAARRHTVPKRLGVIVRGELDWIVMKALEKDRSRRYETAVGLAMDIRRYLAGEAVTAAPPSKAYRFSKLVRRNKGVVMAGGAVAGALLVGVVGFAWQAEIAQQQRDAAVRAEKAEAVQRKAAEDQRTIAVQQREIATQEAARASAMNSFMEQLLTAADPEETGGKDVTVLELLSKASAKADKTLTDQPLVEASARSLLGNTFQSLGKAEEAALELNRAVALRRKHGDTGSFQMAATLRAVGKALSDKGDWKGARDTFEQAQVILLALGEERTGESMSGYCDIAKAEVRLGRFAEAEKALDAADALGAKLSKEIGLDNRAYAAGIRATLASEWKNDLATAEEFARQEVALRRQLDSPVGLGLALNNLAVIETDRNKLEDAIKHYEEVIEVMHGAGEHRLALARENLAGVYYRKKDYERALAMLEPVLKTREAMFGADSLAAARTRVNMGSIALNRGDFRLGLELADAALPIFRRNVGEKSPEYAQVLRSRAVCLKGLGDLDGALREFGTALGIFDAAGAPTAAGRMRTLLNMSEIYCLQGQVERAQGAVDLALKALDASKPDQAKWIKSFQDQMDKCGQHPSAPK